MRASIPALQEVQHNRSTSQLEVYIMHCTVPSTAGPTTGIWSGCANVHRRGTFDRNDCRDSALTAKEIPMEERKDESLMS